MCACVHLHAPVFLLHIENVDKEYVAVEAEYPDVVYVEEQQEFVEADPTEEPVSTANLANPDLQQGKHQNHFHPESYIH